MKYRKRIYYSEKHKALMWDRRQADAQSETGDFQSRSVYFRRSGRLKLLQPLPERWPEWNRAPSLKVAKIKKRRKPMK
jgi:hypothetical protein